MKFALLVGNRGFFPAEVIASAREQMCAAIARAGAECLLIEEGALPHGAVETTEQGARYRGFLDGHRGEIDGVVVCMPNFSDENGIKEAIRDTRAPLLIQAYPDEIGLMDFSHRRDAFCGKLALMATLRQMRVRYTAFEPHVIHPLSDGFAAQLATFMATCRVVKRLRHARIGCLGARTTAFKSVRFDEITLQKYGIDVESIDMSVVYAKVRALGAEGASVRAWRDRLNDFSDYSPAPDGKLDMMAKLAAAVDSTIAEFGLDAIAIRCWSEMQAELGVAPCAILGSLNQLGVPAACETDVGNAVAMLALSAATGSAAGCLDLNNNYGEDPDKCIVFHCGPLPADLMAARGTIEEHKMFAKSFGSGCGWGLNVGRVKPGAITFLSALTEDGALKYYAGEGEITPDPVEQAFFGTAGVLRVDALQHKLLAIGKAGYRHHVSLSLGRAERAICEAFDYLGYERTPV